MRQGDGSRGVLFRLMVADRVAGTHNCLPVAYTVNRYQTEERGHIRIQNMSPMNVPNVCPQNKIY
jgi:hypothetical protein